MILSRVVTDESTNIDSPQTHNAYRELVPKDAGVVGYTAAKSRPGSKWASPSPGFPMFKTSNAAPLQRHTVNPHATIYCHGYTNGRNINSSPAEIRCRTLPCPLLGLPPKVLEQGCSCEIPPALRQFTTHMQFIPERLNKEARLIADPSANHILCINETPLHQSKHFNMVVPGVPDPSFNQCLKRGHGTFDRATQRCKTLFWYKQSSINLRACSKLLRRFCHTFRTWGRDQSASFLGSFERAGVDMGDAWGLERGIRWT